MKSELPKKVSKMLWEFSEAAKDKVIQNVITTAKNNDIKITHEDLQKLCYIVSSTVDQVSFDASRNFENRLSEMVIAEADSKSSSK